MKVKMIKRENIPAWYYLSWQDEPPAIILGVHRDFIDNIRLANLADLMAIGFMEEFRFRNFSGDFNKSWGFDDSFKKMGEKDDFVEFNIALSAIRNDKKNAHAISASFSVFFAVAFFSEVETSSLFPQLLTINTVTEQRDHGGSLSGQYSIPLVKWLVSQCKDRGVIPEMIRAMKSACKCICGSLRGFNQNEFKASVKDELGWLNVSCPGNACDLHPQSQHDLEEGFGYAFDSHNVDTPVQQIILLAGLAALYDLVRKNIKR